MEELLASVQIINAAFIHLQKLNVNTYANLMSYCHVESVIVMLGSGLDCKVGENYDIWAVKMKAYLRAFDLWEVVEVVGELPEQRPNPTVAQMKQNSEEVAKRFTALSIIHSTVSDTIFTRIMSCESPKDAWDCLKEKFHGSERTRQMQALNLNREFEILRMKDNESIKEYSYKIMKLVNQLRLLELVNALQAQEQKRAYRNDDAIANALVVRTKDFRISENNPRKREGDKGDNEWRNDDGNSNKPSNKFFPMSILQKE
ncbi:protein of unknown function DUF4219 - like 4 [Theobroma cacao]|nr:protein of unknown function DUF4219 - like 4 [Theobroma cacao]